MGDEGARQQPTVDDLRQLVADARKDADRAKCLAADAAKAAAQAAKDRDEGRESARSVRSLLLANTAVAALAVALVAIVALIVFAVFANSGVDRPFLSTASADVIALGSAGTAILMVLAGLASAGGDPPAPGPYIDRELAEQRARRTTMTAFALILVGVVLLGTTMLASTSGAVEVQKAKASASVPPDAEAADAP
jgi:hypothetical protein